MKRIIFYVTIVLLIGLGFFLFFKAKQAKILPSQAEIGQTTDTNLLKSLQGSVTLDSRPRPIDTSSNSVLPPPDPQLAAERNPFESNEAPSASSFSFAVIGDTQRFTANNPNGNFQKASASISKLNPNLAIAVGDLIGGCEGKSSDAQDYADWKKILGPLAGKTYAVQGNHDRVSDGESCDRIWQNAFTFPTNGSTGFSELTYSLDYGNSRFVFLDSIKPDGHQVSETQRAWLEQNLAANRKENTFVFFHEPAFPTGAKIGESLDADPGERNALWQILDKYNVTAVFNGHEHIVSRRKIDSSIFPGAKNSIYQLVFANTDSFDHDLPKPGVAEYASNLQGSFGLVKVTGKKITVETHSSDGNLLNTFTFSK
jgi:3',5'-cyclic-AMP phosphodiesterase